MDYETKVVSGMMEKSGGVAFCEVWRGGKPPVTCEEIGTMEITIHGITLHYCRPCFSKYQK